MQFISRYSYLWKFPHEQEIAYARFVKPSNISSLRLVSFITIFGMALFLAIDFFRNVDYSIVVATRLAAFIVAGTTMTISFRKELPGWAIYGSIAILTFTNLGVSIVTATFANMPSFYLTNLLFLIFVLVITASGLHFRHALLLNFLCLTIFIIYSQLVNRDSFYFSQYPHLFSIFIYIHIVGLVLENRRRNNFLHFQELAEQKRLVEELNQQKNKIISILSHDISSPLNSLAGLLNLHTNGLMKSEELTPFITKVGDKLENVNSLLRSLTRWSKSQLKGFVPDKKVLNVCELIQNKINLFAPQAYEKGIEFKFSSSMPIRVLCDSDMINLILRNLFSNAIKFSNLNSVVEIDLMIKSIETVLIRVSNEGRPIPPEQKEKLFTYQINSTEGTIGEKGTGLGLAMSAYFVELNQGRIYLDDSIPGRTTFCIELPAIPIDR